MRWGDTIASTCRYGEIADRIFGDADIIFENSECDYQGFANVFAKLSDGRFCHYEWTYGSCSGCDEWEDRDLNDDEIEQIMRDGAVYFDDLEVVKRYLHLSDEFKEAKIPSANSTTNGSIPGMLRILSGGPSEDFLRIGEAFEIWFETQ